MEPKTSTPPAEPRHPSVARRQEQPSEKPRDRYWLHALLFVVTLCTTIHMGGQFVGRYAAHQDLGFWWFVPDGIRFAVSLLGFLTVHEFGHYFAARYHRINTSLPYYIPLPFIAIGTAGAVIRIREPIPSTRKLFDIGAAGPIAGFVVSLALLIYALATLPPPEYVTELPGHEPLRQFYEENGYFPSDPPPSESEGLLTLIIGQTPLYWFLTQFFSDVPPMYEMYHYPVLMAGWFGLFFTALNLLPVGQLDGGHILYALVGHRWHRFLAQAFVIVLLLSGAIGFLRDMMPLLYDYADWMGQGAWFILAGILYFFLSYVFKGDHRLIAPTLLVLILLSVGAQALGEVAMQLGWSGWLFWVLLIVFFVKIEHPPVVQPEPLTPRRRMLGVLSILIFILCFSIVPIRIL